MVIPALQPGEVHRTTNTIVAAGGKGLNVARSLKNIGGTPLARGLLGGYNGRVLADLVATEAVDAVWTWTTTETRTSVIIAPADQDATVINEPGPAITEDTWAQLTADVAAQAAHARIVCLSGSLPPGCSEDAPGDLITAVQQTGCPIWVDTSGSALKQAVRARPDGIKVNLFEAAELLGQPWSSLATNEVVTWAVDAAHQLHKMDIPTVVLTLGKLGAVLINAEGAWWGQSPPIKLVSSVGSGDAFFAGLLHEFSQSEDAASALRSAIAAGSANATVVGGGIFSQATFAALRDKTTISSLAGLPCDSETR